MTTIPDLSVDPPTSHPPTTDPPAVDQPAAPSTPPTVLPPIVLPPMRGPQIHSTSRWRKGLFKVSAPGAPTTSRQAEVLNTALIGSPTDERGLIVGSDTMSSSMIAHDPFTAYENKQITSPNVCVVGMVGAGKSSLLKILYVERPLMLRGRCAVVIDKKLRDGEGEYAELTREFGAEPFRFDPNDPEHSTCMNPLDGIIRAAGGAAAQRQLLAAFAEQAGSGEELTEWHHKALAEAYRLVISDFETGKRTPVMPDLLARFTDVVNADQFTHLRPATLDLIEQAAVSMMLRFERLLADDLQGMFDRETSKHVRLHPKLTTFDISALPEDGPATSLVMVMANSWLMGMLGRHRRPGMRTNFVVEEGWALASGPGGRMIRSKSKLARGYGLSVIAAFHHISDHQAGSDAIAMMQEAQTRHLFRQEHDTDIADCVRYFNLEPSNATELATLPQGTHLLKIGALKEIRVQADRTEREIAFTATDSAMVTRHTPIEVVVK